MLRESAHIFFLKSKNSNFSTYRNFVWMRFKLIMLNIVFRGYVRSCVIVIGLHFKINAGGQAKVGDTSKNGVCSRKLGAYTPYSEWIFLKKQ